uniref:hypothetical protein n=1 Tax=Olsenella timonensis TaxID=1805478 RepID=UPI000A4E3391|nr:hypothetical protein [Olsenella timonensis]
MRVAFGTVVYPAALKYQNEYVRSLNNQVGQEFDVLLVNDGLSATQREVIEASLSRPVAWTMPERQLTIPELRVKLLRDACLRGYDVLVLGDFDDTFSPERVASMADYLNDEFVFCYHNLDVNGRPLFDALPTVTSSVDPILDSNYLGFGNTAIRLRALPQGFLDELVGAPAVFDWYFYSLLLLSATKGRLVPGSLTNYRLHNVNMAGVQHATKVEVENEVAVKYQHYSALSEKGSVFTMRMKAYSETIPSRSWWVVGPRDGRWWSLTTSQPPKVYL